MVKLNGSRSSAPKSARGEVVVLAQRVGEPLPLHDDHAAGVAVQAAEGEPDEHHEQGDVEEQVPGLPEVAALCRDLVRRDVHPVPAAAEHSRARSSTAEGSSSRVNVRDSGSRDRFRGALGGRARMARQ